MQRTRLVPGFLILGLLALCFAVPGRAAPPVQTLSARLAELAEWITPTAQGMLERASEARPLKLEIAPAQEIYPLFAPVTLFVRLTNTGAERVQGRFLLSEAYGHLWIYVAGPGHDFVPFFTQEFLWAQVSDMELPPPRALAPGETITRRMTVAYNHFTQDYGFPLAGTHRVKAVYGYAYDLAERDRRLASDAAEINIVSPEAQDARALPLFEGAEQAQVLQGESRHPEAIAALRAVVERFPDTEYALYAQAALEALPAEVSGLAEVSAERPLGPRHRALLERDTATLADRSQPWHARLGAALRLGGLFGHKDAVAPLARVLADGTEDLELRRGCATALTQISHVSAVEPLLAALDDPDAQLRDHARSRLLRIGVWASRAQWEQRKETWRPPPRWRLLSEE